MTVELKNKKMKRDTSSALRSAGNDRYRERRGHDRYPANLQARLFYGNMIYSGMVTNISQSGMFVNTQIDFPVNSQFVMVVLLNERTLKVPVKVKRTAGRDDNNYSRPDSGIGIELLDIPQNYLDYVGACKSSLRRSF